MSDRALNAIALAAVTAAALGLANTILLLLLMALQ